jgi:hypothetical protein
MTIENDPANGIWRHKCEMPECQYHIIYDDEPYCYTHSPDEGSSVRGYSAYANYLQSLELNENGIPVDWEHHPYNV